MALKSKQALKYNELVIGKAAKAKVARQQQWTIDGVPGLTLVVKPTGAASWLVRYQVGKGNNRQRRSEVIGRFGAITLAEAREKAQDIERQAAKGVDVVAETKAASRAPTLRQLFADRLERDKDTAPRTLEDYKAVLDRDVFPSLGDKPANQITPEQFAIVLEGIAKRAEHAAHKARSALGSTYKWGMRQWSAGVRPVTLNPIVSVGFTVQSDRRKRVLTDKEMARLWAAIETHEHVGAGVKSIIRLAILTGQRNSEVAGMEVSELKGLDAATPRWDIPAERMKRKSDDQHVPLSRQALAIVRDALPGSNGKHVFQGTTHGRFGGTWRQEHIGQETVSRAFRTIADSAGLRDVVLHDMRKCVTSWLAEHGHATSEVLDAILHHGRKGVTGTHYNFALYEKQVRKSLQVWADHVDTVASGAGAGQGNVVAFAGVSAD